MKAKIGNLLDNLRSDILSTLSTQMDTLQVKQKNMKLEKNMVIFCLNCKKKHPPRKCPLKSMEECEICKLSHATNSCPSLQGLKVIFQGIGEEVDKIYFMGSKKPGKPQPPTVNQGMF